MNKIPDRTGTPNVQRTPLAVGLADDHPIVLDGLSQLLNELPGIRIAFQAETLSALHEELARHAVDVLVVDPGMRGLSDLPAKRQIRVAHPTVKVLYFCSVWDAMFARYCAETLGCTCVSKMNSLLEIRTENGPLLPIPRPLHVLSKSEVRVVRLIAEGRRLSHIACVLERSPKTVSTHKINAQNKLGVTNTLALVQRWRLMSALAAD